MIARQHQIYSLTRNDCSSWLTVDSSWTRLVSLQRCIHRCRPLSNIMLLDTCWQHGGRCYLVLFHHHTTWRQCLLQLTQPTFNGTLKRTSYAVPAVFRGTWIFMQHHAIHRLSWNFLVAMAKTLPVFAKYITKYLKLLVDFIFNETIKSSLVSLLLW